MSPFDDFLQAVAGMMKIDPDKAERRKDFLEIDGRDVELLRDLHERLGSRRLDFMRELHEHIAAFEETRRFVQDPAVLERLKRSQATYFERLTAGDYDWRYVADRLRIGVLHQCVGLEPHWYVACYRTYLQWVLPNVWRLYPGDENRALDTLHALLKVIFLDLGLVIDAHLHADRHAMVATKAYAEKVIATVPSGLLVLNEDLRVVLVNRSFQGAFGVRHQDVVGRPLDEVLPARGLRGHVLEVMSSGKCHYGLMCEIRDPGREPRPLRITIASIEIAEGEEQGDDEEARLLLVVEDLTEEERLRTQARASERSFRTLIEQTPDAIAVHRDGCFIYVNPSMVRLLGYSSQGDVIGLPVLDIVHPDDRDVVAERIRVMMTTGEMAPPREDLFLRKDGSVVHAEVVAMPLMFEGEPAVVAIGRDVTERRELTARMMQMDRMIAVGTLAAGVGHEINNPLTYVCANVSFALEQIDQVRSFTDAVAAELATRFGEQTAESILTAAGVQKAKTTIYDLEEVLSQAREGSDRIRDIVRDLKTFSRGDDEQRETLDVHKVIGSAIDMGFNEIRHRARLVKDFGVIPPVAGNRSRLGQVFLNLLVNAAHAIPEGAAERNEIRIHTTTDLGQAVIEIRDTGAGIAPDDVQKIFDPFFSTKPVGQGTGLGLSICRRIVESIGGKIEVESEIGKGSVFRILLPPAEISTPPPLPPTESSLSGRRGRILVIDDEPVVALVLQRTLEEEHDVETVTAARDALERLEAGQCFDLILCDLMMPDMTGMDLYDRICQIAPVQAERMIFMTGGAFTPRAREFLARTPNLHVEKPFDAKNLRSLVRDLLK